MDAVLLDHLTEGSGLGSEKRLAFFHAATLVRKDERLRAVGEHLPHDLHAEVAGVAALDLHGGHAAAPEVGPLHSVAVCRDQHSVIPYLDHLQVLVLVEAHALVAGRAEGPLRASTAPVVGAQGPLKLEAGVVVVRNVVIRPGDQHKSRFAPVAGHVQDFASEARRTVLALPLAQGLSRGEKVQRAAAKDEVQTPNVAAHVAGRVDGDKLGDGKRELARLRLRAHAVGERKVARAATVRHVAGHLRGAWLEVLSVVETLFDIPATYAETTQNLICTCDSTQGSRGGSLVRHPSQKAEVLDDADAPKAIHGGWRSKRSLRK
mmetsp:Transcript_10799/g.32513  ORF Transcript_10799/g.32513 Transcript_10799/m.32513 type:complete len:320 (+) Transcript_10799:340-1299(+)